ncbi:hypothetical protein NQ318_004413 [Aromia moschata]|uniref:DDE Tnp4 domain-containing protein n=1 Tax=Aromia moschata TaxID=1265417 RepID=A0AAV8Y6V0_9CUCU|nr:hypothetical protein NQ318_004413 [Aromia moschata]
MLIASALLVDDEQERKERPRRWWAKPWLNREKENISLSGDMRHGEDTQSYKNYLRMDDNVFKELLNKIEKHIRKESYTRECITPRQNQCTIVSCLVPNTTAEWLEISRDFEEKWNTPNIVGALDGKHIVIKAPAKQGSAFYNYKGQHSIALLAMADANYNFTCINVGINGLLQNKTGVIFQRINLYLGEQPLSLML